MKASLRDPSNKEPARGLCSLYFLFLGPLFFGTSFLSLGTYSLPLGASLAFAEDAPSKKELPYTDETDQHSSAKELPYTDETDQHSSAKELPYTDETDQYSPPQLYYFGIAYYFGGKLQIQTPEKGSVTSNSLNVSYPQFVIGGLHHSGYVDYYMALLSPSPSREEEAVSSYFVKSGFPSVGIGVRFYPLRLEDKSFNPFVGISWTPISFRQGFDANTFTSDNSGPLISQHHFPYQIGFDYERWPLLIQFGIRIWDSDKFSYPISPTQNSVIQLPSPEYWAGLRGGLDMTKVFYKQSTPSKSKNSFHLGIGLLLAWNQGSGDYISSHSPFMDTLRFSTGPELAVGYELGDSKTIINLTLRNISAKTGAFSYVDKFVRDAEALEIFKIFWDTPGLQPFAGLSLDHSKLSFTRYSRGTWEEAESSKTTLGLVFGWDLRPVEKWPWYLRTTLRYYPPEQMEITENNFHQKVRFANWEFNFIEFIFLPGYISRL